eukprot:TRINITY_DN7532_c0_g1_i5.p1 TRINITY_DN7532_c0_g1~~TRINITY_DN7532_c0_g1_i5.p1  ORF type:complete len:486 (-),score=40.47 TRINITY_DN7532_c0_g1_i5:25-1410(-)
MAVGKVLASAGVGWCLPGQQCHDGDCCALGSSCNTCPHGYQVNNYACALKGNYVCKSKPFPSPTPTPGWCLPGQSCSYLDCCALGSSCNTCPNGYVTEDNVCAGRGNRICKPENPSSGPTCSGQTASATGQCHESKWKNACIMVNGRGELPTVDNDKKFEISIMRAPIEGEPSKPEEKQMAAKLGLYHSAVLVQEACGSFVGSRVSFLIEFDAVNFDESAVLPIGVNGSGIIWNSTGRVTWYDAFDPALEPKYSHVGSKQMVVTTHGDVVNKWLDSIPRWYEENPNYGLWSSFGGPIDQPTQFISDNQCHQFVEWSLIELYSQSTLLKKALFQGLQAPFCRNYAAVFGSKPELLDMRQPSVVQDVMTFYKTLGSYAKRAMTDPKDTTILSELKSWVESNRRWYIADPTRTKYYRVDLEWPYAFADAKYSTRPMKLPWQNQEIFVIADCPHVLSTLETALVV